MSDANLEPFRFGRFTLVKRLASGGMGEVFLAKLQGPAGFEKLLVIKRVLENLSDRADFVDMFLTEARVAAKLTHRNIAQIYEMGRTEGAYYIAMEYVLGRSLSDLLKTLRASERRIPPAHAIEIATQGCDGLAYAHRARDSQGPLNVIHRDISPRNVLLSYSGEVKVIDFGIAKSRMSLEPTAAGVIKGKLGYMSPEQSAARKLDRRSDIFSFGLVLYELCSCTHPFVREDPILTFDAIQRLRPEPLASFDARYAPLDAVIARAMEKEPGQRYGDCDAMRRDLHKLLLSGEVPMARDSLAEYLHDVFADEVADDHALAEAVSAISAEEVEEEDVVEVSAIEVLEPIAEPNRVPQIGRPALVLLLAIFAFGVIGSMGLYGLGQRHGHASKPRIAVVEPLPVARSEPRVVPQPPPPTVEVAPPEPVVVAADPEVDPEPEPQTVEAKRKPEPKPVLGSIEISTQPPMRVSRKGRRVNGKLTLRAANGVLQVGGGKDATSEPFKLRVAYRVSTHGVDLTIRAEPWAIAQSQIGAGLGRTPIHLKGVRAGAKTVLSLTNPVEKRHVQLTLVFSR